MFCGVGVKLHICDNIRHNSSTSQLEIRVNGKLPFRLAPSTILSCRSFAKGIWAKPRNLNRKLRPSLSVHFLSHTLASFLHLFLPPILASFPLPHSSPLFFPFAGSLLRWRKFSAREIRWPQFRTTISLKMKRKNRKGKKMWKRSPEKLIYVHVKP